MVKRVSLIVAGWALLLLGAIGLFLPVLPGVLFLLIGLSILSVEYEWARRWVHTLRRRFPMADRSSKAFLPDSDASIPGLTKNPPTAS